jgi:large subunit ribosomal protein L15
MASTKAADGKAPGAEPAKSGGQAGDGRAADSRPVGGKAGLKVHHLRPAPGAHRPRTRVGRGGGSKGKTAGRGTKGSKARTSISPAFEGGQMPLHRRLPKLKGFSNARFKVTYQVVNLDRLAELYPSGGDVTPADLASRGAVRSGGLVKVLGSGEAVSGLRVTAHAFSASAIEKITSAGGTATKL